jgi:methylsterol monooxygenase
MLIQTCFEHVWRSMEQRYDGYHIATYGTFLLHEICYFGLCFPGFMIQFIPSLKKYKIQQDVPDSLDQQWKCLQRLLFYHFFVHVCHII